MIRKKSNTAGTTMVELIVTFALMAIFMSAAVMVLTATMNFHFRVKSTVDASNVIEILLEKVCGEIAGADNNYKVIISNAKALEPQSKSTDGDDRIGTVITLVNRNSSPIRIQNDDGYLLIYYYPERFGEAGPQYPSVEWKFDKNLYMNYKIIDMTFEQLKVKGTEESYRATNVIEVIITLKNVRTGFVYTASRCVECYNYVEGWELEGNIIFVDERFSSVSV